MNKPRYRRRVFVLLMVIVLVAAACASDGTPAAGKVVLDAAEPDPAVVDDNEPVAGDLDRALDRIVLETGVPALGAALFDNNGMIYMAASGVRHRGDSTEATVDDLFHLGSNTKAMTAALLARLEESNRGISFDTTLASAFVDIGDLNSAYADVTMAQLLTHTGGTPGDDFDIDETILSMPVVEGRAIGAELILSEAPAHPPGTVSSYSNAGYVIVGAAMEATTGESWEELMVTEVFVPLGMDSCAFGPPGTEGDIDQPYGHDNDGKPVSFDNPQLLGPAGTVHCSMGDWGKFLVELLNGLNGTSDYLSPASFERMFEPALAPVEGLPAGQSAAGWLVLDGPDGLDSVAYFHNGSNTAWYSQAVILPTANRVVLAVSNEERTGEQAAEMAFAALSELEGGQ